MTDSDVEKALTHYRQLLAVQPGNITALFYSAVLQERRASFFEAAALFHQITCLQADQLDSDEKSMYEIARDHFRVYFYGGIEAMQKLQFAEAMMFFLHINSDGFPRRPSLYHAGLCCLRLKHLPTAKELFRLLLSAMPYHVDAWLNLGNTEHLLGNTQEAARCYEQAIQLEPDFAEAHYNLNLLTQPKGRYWKNAKPPISFKSVPIFINCRDRCKPLKQLVEWLLKAGYKNIILLDNASNYPPLLAYYQNLLTGPDNQFVKVIMLGENLGHQALWRSGALRRLGIDTCFVYTDPDIVPVDECPTDVIEVFWQIMSQNPFVQKVGFGLKIDDIPDCFGKKNEILAHEGRLWDHQLPGRLPEQYLAPIDTTFALYRHGNYYEVPHSIRTGQPYLARHTDWYIDTGTLDEETQYYFDHSAQDLSWTQKLLDKKSDTTAG